MVRTADLDHVPPENTIERVTCGSCQASSGVRVLVDQVVEDGFSVDLPGVGVWLGGRRSAAPVIGDALGDALMRPGAVVMNLVLGQDGAQMLLAEDQYAVEEL